jgi:hypothetical protein
MRAPKLDRLGISYFIILATTYLVIKSLHFLITLTSTAFSYFLSLRPERSSQLSAYQHRHFVFFSYFERSNSVCFIIEINYDSLFRISNK